MNECRDLTGFSSIVDLTVPPPNWDYTPEFVISADGSYIVDRGVWSGSSPTGEFAVPTLALHEISDRKIVATTVYYAAPGLPLAVQAVLGPPPAAGD